MTTSITTHNVVSETLRVNANHVTGTEWVELWWKNANGEKNSITLFLADDDARSALQHLATQILNATVEFEVKRELESNQ
jgi:C4-type Zn-finger protein